MTVTPLSYKSPSHTSPQIFFRGGARIPEAELERLKHEIPLARLAAARGIALQPSGKNLLGLCPFHDDHAPSLSIDPAQNLWHCFGCQQGGGVIDWVMKAEGVSFRHAVELLRAEVPLPSAGPVVKQSSMQKLPSLLTTSAEDQELLQQVLAHYQQNLIDTPDALAYLQKRGLHSSEMIATFTLGFANRTLGYRLPAKKWLAGAELRGRLQTLGILRASGHEHFHGCLVIPIRDAQGNITEMYGRKITPALRTGTPLHLYLPGPHKGVWNLQACHTAKEIILCEALIDALTFWCAGYHNVTASYGVDGFTADHLEAFQQHGIEKVLIAYDADEAGERGAQKLAAQLRPLGIACSRVHFPNGMDANEYALKTHPAEKSLGVVLHAATCMGTERPGANIQGPAAPEAPPPPAAVPGPPREASEKPVLTSSAAVAPLVPDTAETAPPEPALHTSPVPPLTPNAPLPTPLSAEVKAEEVLFTIGDRRYRVRGLQKNLSYDQLRINLFAARDDAFFVDTLDLYHARQRHQFIKQAATELALSDDTIKKDIGKVLLQLEALHDQQIQAMLTPKEPEVILTDEERAAALELLHVPHLLDRILTDFQGCGVVGEETNKLVGYLAAVSRLLDKPLAVLIQSSSAAGKTALMDAILACLPDEAKVKYSALTGQALFYLGEKDLKHKILALVEEEGAARAAYALKLLQSEGELTIASTGKDPQTGKLVTHEYRVQG